MSKEITLKEDEMPKLELGILRYSNYKAIEISASPTDISGGGTPYYPFFSIKLNVTLKPILPAEGNPINFVLTQMGGYLSLQNNERIADFWTEPIFSETHDKERNFPQQLTIPLDCKRIERIEAVRSGGDIQLNLHFFGTVWIKDDEEYRVPDKMVSSGNFLALKIPQSYWVGKVLPDLGYGKFKLIEVPIPEKIIADTLQKAIEELAQAQQYFVEGDYDKTVEHCRSAIEVIPNTISLSFKPGEKQSFSAKVDKFWEHFKGFLSNSKRDGVSKIMKALWNLGSIPHHLSPPGYFSRADAEAIMMITTAVVAYAGKSLSSKEEGS